MSAVLERRPKPKIRGTSGSGDTLDALRPKIAKVTTELQRLEEARVEAEKQVQEHRAVIEDARHRRAELIALHQSRASGRTVTVRKLGVAERAVATAEDKARFAEAAEQGCASALARYVEQTAARQAELSELTTKAKQTQIEVIQARALESRRRYLLECEKFAQVYATHVADVRAAELAAKTLGLDDLSNVVATSVAFLGADAAVQLPTSWLRFLPLADCTDEERRGLHGVRAFDIAEEVRSRAEPLAQEIAKELEI